MHGAATAIKAIGDGRKAANQIIKQASVDFKIEKNLKGKEFTKKELILKRAKRQFAPELKELELTDRKNFKLVSETLDKETIVKEADRCLQCDEICNICTTVCPNFANYSYEVERVSYYLQKVIQHNGEVKTQNEGIFEITQKYQILNIANFCNECGNCNTFCPTNSAPYKEKPKFWLTKSSFDLAKEGYFIENDTITYKHKGEIFTLKDLKDEYLYNTPKIEARINKADFSIIETQFKSKDFKEAKVYRAAEMSILLKGAKNLYLD